MSLKFLDVSYLEQKLKSYLELNQPFSCRKHVRSLRQQVRKFDVFGYENKLVYPIHISDQKFENSIDLFLVIDENKPHYVYIKDFDRFMFHKTKTKTKNNFAKVIYSVLRVEKYGQNIKKFV